LFSYLSSRATGHPRAPDVVHLGGGGALSWLPTVPRLPPGVSEFVLLQEWRISEGLAERSF
jgi:hypothetical protein